MDEQVIERQLPEAPHWNGHGKYGPALCMDECTLHIMSRGFGTKDGDGYLTFDPNKFDWERDDEGSEYMVVPLTNSDLLFLRDQLNTLFPAKHSTKGWQDDDVERARDRALSLIDAAEQGMIAERKAEYGTRFNASQEANIRVSHHQQKRGVQIMYEAARAALDALKQSS